MSVISSGILVVSGVTSSCLDFEGKGQLQVKDSGFATQIGLYAGGTARVSSGGILYLCNVESGGTASVLKSGYAEAVTVNRGGLFLISSGGTADESYIHSGGTQIIYADVVAASATVMDGGELHVSSGGVATSAVVSSGGTLYVRTKGLANYGTVAGTAQIDSGGVLSSSTVLSGGAVNLASGCYVYSILAGQGGIVDVSGGRAAMITAESGGVVNVSSGGYLSAATARDNGAFHIFDGAMTSQLAVRTGGEIHVSGGTANRTTVNSEGRFEIHEKGTANSTTVKSGGSMVVSSGGTATAIQENGGYVSIEEGANVGFTSHTFTGVELAGASATVHSGTTAVNTFLKGGKLEVFSGGSAADTTIGSGGRLEVKTGGTATNVIWTPCVGTVTSAEGARVTFASAYAGVYYGSMDVLVSSAPVLETQTVGERETMYVFSGGTAGDLSALSGGTVIVTGGTLTGRITVETGADVSAGEEAELNFDLRRNSSGAGALVNDLSAIRGTLLYTLTVNGDMKTGKYDYSLADGAGAFDGAITMLNAAGETLGSLEVGEKTVLDGVEYLLILAASNLSVTVDVPDATPPTVSDIRVTPGTPTNQDVLVTAVFSDDSGTARGYYHLEDEVVWNDYLDGVVVTKNTTVYLKAVNSSGLESEVAEFAVTNIDKVPPVITLDADTLTPRRRTTLTASTEPGIDMYYSRDGAAWTLYTGPIEVTENGSYEFKAADDAGNTGTAGIVFENIYPAAPQNPVGTAQRVSWDPVGAKRYILEYSTDHFEHGFRAAAAGSAVDMFELPAGIYQWRVRADDSDEWTIGNEIDSDNTPGTPKAVQSNADGNGDIFFAETVGIWGESGYFFLAQHVGSVNDWNGTNDLVFLDGKGRIQNLFFGSSDPNVLCLTDGENGDAIFVDDVFTDLPDSVAEHQSRLAGIDEIRAGAGDDVVDMTSQRFEYIGDGLTIRGGDGDDTLWANKGKNMLFGDAGNDRIVGASGNDVIAGGIGNDRMHGGGGNDVFTFCDNWGEDTVQQLATGRITLWFASGSPDNWNPNTLTYTDGANSVKVEGLISSRIELKFGSDGSEEYAELAAAGAFDAFSSARIFEAKGTGILASL